MNIEDIMMTMPACPKCGLLFVPCNCDADAARVDKVDQFRKAMAEELRKAGYTVSPPKPDKLQAIPPIDLKTSQSSMEDGIKSATRSRASRPVDNPEK